MVIITDIDYNKLKEDVDTIISNISLIVDNIDLSKLTTIKKKIGMVKAIISDISKINDCCGKGTGSVDPLIMMLIMNTMKAGGSKEVILEKLKELIPNTDKADLQKAEELWRKDGLPK